MLRSLIPLALAGAVQAQWSMSAQPVLHIGSDAGPDYQFNRIEHLRRLSDGRIVVTSGPDIRFFGPSGTFLAKAGGRGRGPGEFQWVSDLLVMRGDSLMTMNVRTIVVLDAQGKFVRQVQPDLQPLASSDWFTEGSVLLPNGNLLSPQYTREKPGPKPSGVFRPVIRYSIFDLATLKVTPLHTSGDIAQAYVDGRPVVMPFTPREVQAIGTDRVYVGDNDSTVIHAFALDGTPAGTIVVADKRIAVTAAELEAEKARRLEFATMNRMSKQAFEQQWAAGPKPTHHPYWGTALVDRTGALWVSNPARGGDAPIAWTTFDRNGKRLSAVTMPARFTPKDIGSDYVLGVQRDEDGVETIAIYSLRRR